MPWGVIAFSGDYDPYPREYEKVKISDKTNTMLIDDIKFRFDVDAAVMETISVDLDGDGAAEHIVHARDETEQSHYVCLINENDEIISYLLACTKDENEIEYDLENEIEMVDIDGDGFMEILLVMIIYEGFIFNVYEYDNGVFGGEFINKCSTRP